MDPKTIVQEFLSASTTDVSRVRHLLADELIWELNGEVQTETADAFIARQLADLATGSAETTVDSLVADGDQVMLIGWASFTPNEGDDGTMRMKIAESLSLTNGKITRICDVMATS